MKARAALALVMAALLAPLAAAEEDRPAQPFELVRSLRALQDRIAQGDAAAHANQGKLIRDIARQLLAFGDEVWQDPRNGRAVILYALSGGDPAVLRELTERVKLKGVDERLIKGVLAYGRGRNAEAAEHLLAINARSLDPPLSGQLALVQSLLVAKSDPRKALALLDDARLLVPGTLIEEAALRREVVIAAAQGEFDRFEFLSAQYMRRFPSSLYSAGFRQQFATNFARRLPAGDQGRLSALESAVKTLSPADRQELYLDVAREAVVRARIELTRTAAAEACKGNCLTEVGLQRARLYEAAALIVTDQFEHALSTLKGLTRARLADDDAELLDAALAVAREVRRPPRALRSLDEQGGSPASGKEGVIELNTQLLETAQKAISRADELINRSAR
jgi:chemotaxis protein MotC